MRLYKSEVIGVFICTEDCARWMFVNDNKDSFKCLRTSLLLIGRSCMLIRRTGVRFITTYFPRNAVFPIPLALKFPSFCLVERRWSNASKTRWSILALYVSPNLLGRIATHTVTSGNKKSPALNHRQKIGKPIGKEYFKINLPSKFSQSFTEYSVQVKNKYIK